MGKEGSSDHNTFCPEGRGGVKCFFFFFFVMSWKVKKVERLKRINTALVYIIPSTSYMIIL